MTKHWPEQSLSALPALSHLGEYHDHQLDFHRNAQQGLSLRGIARCSPPKHWTHHPAQMAPQQPPRLEKPPERPEHLNSATAFMDKAAPPGSSFPNFQDASCKQETIVSDSWNGERSKRSGGKKKNYQRYPKPPYSYLAMIAMVIQRSPEKKLTLSEVRIIFCAQWYTHNNLGRLTALRIYTRCFLVHLLTCLNHSPLNCETALILLRNQRSRKWKFHVTC